MANYMKDPRANMVSENGVFLDWCGDDTRYYYNGSYVDLCGMSPEEYMKNWFCCGENNGGGGSTDVTKNAIVLTQQSTTTESGEPAVMLMVRSTKPTASDVTVTVQYDYIDEETNEIKSETVAITIPSGADVAKMMLPRPSITITSAKPSPEFDDAFEYVTEGNISSVIGCLFHGVYPEKGADEGITVGLENIIKDVTCLEDGTYNATVEVPYTHTVSSRSKLTTLVLCLNLLSLVKLMVISKYQMNQIL